MGKFIKKISLFITISLGLIILLNFFLMSQKPPGWGRSGKGINEKINYLLSGHSEVSTIFVGSSRVRHHIIPRVIDSITGEESVNLGYNAMYFPEVIYLTEAILKDNSLAKLKYLIIELSDMRMINSEGTILENSYWLDGNMYNFLNSYVSNDPCMNEEYKEEYLNSLKVLYTKRLLGLGTGLHYWSSVTSKEMSLKKMKEFAPLEKQHAGTQSHPPGQDVFDEHRKEVFNYKLNTNCRNTVLIDKLESLNSLAQEKGINLYFLIQPLYPQEMIVPSLENENFNVLDMRYHEESYDSTNYFDGVHYNDKGAQAFSKSLANKVLEEINNIK